MQLDAALLDQLEKEKKAILHLYDWIQPSITYGYFLNPYDYLNQNTLKTHNIEIAKRPTGGGVTLHLSDLAFSVVVPNTHPWFSNNTLDCYLAINQKVQDSFIGFFGKNLGFSLQPLEPQIQGAAAQFCMAKPTKYDVMVDGQKIGGAAQRRTKHGFLHQGTISLGLLPTDFLYELILQKEVVDAMLENSFAPLGQHWSEQELIDAREQMKRVLTEVFCGE